MTASAGWYLDPDGGTDRYRWWDGASWTRYLSTDQNAPAPGGELDAAEPAAEPTDSAAVTSSTRAPEPPTPELVAAVATEGGSSSGSTGGVAVATHPVPAPADHPPPDGRPVGRAYPPGSEEVTRPRPRRAVSKRPWPKLLAAGVVVALLVGVFAILVGGGESRQLLSPPPTDIPSTPPPTAEYDDSTREATVAGLTVVMPGGPYQVYRSDTPAGGILRDGVDSYATVHRNYDKDDTDWVASISVGFVADQYVGADAEETIGKLYDAYIGTAYAGAKVKTTKREETAYDEYPHPTRILTTDAHYSVPGVASSYDDVSLLVVDNEDGSYSALIAARPNKRSDKAEKAAQQTFDQINVNE